MVTQKNASKKPMSARADAGLHDALALGQRLRILRRSAGLSLSELAQRAGVSVGMISQIERNLANPSVRMLERLRVALNVPLTTLLEGDGPDFVPPGQANGAQPFVRRANQRPHFSVGAGGLAKELLSPHGDHDLQFMIIAIPPFTRSEEILLGPGEKAGMVLAGEIALTVGERVERLSEGDSFQFRSTVPHGVENPCATPARILWIMNTKPPIIHL